VADRLDEHKIGIALSGGGSRAIAFHLGCLRCLDRLGLLTQAKVLSTVSGGSVIGALYVLHEGPFEEFEARIRPLLRQGLVRPSLQTALMSLEGVKAAACGLVLGATSILRLLPHFLETAGLWPPASTTGTMKSPRLRRVASRTTILRRTLDRVLFKGARISDTDRPGRPRWIAIATELRSGSAFYFSPSTVGSWRFGRAKPAEFSVAHAVAASAAFPLLLPALDETLAFEQKDGSTQVERVSLTDGGVYDNLGLAPLWPDRDRNFSLQVEDVDTIIACRAGDGLRLANPGLFFLERMTATFAVMHDRAQNATMKRLFDLKADGRLKAFLLPYLGQDDRRLQNAPADLVPRASVINYPTNFSPMQVEWIDRLSQRGDQVTLAVIREHAPDLLPPGG
jgi:NTE family protein